MNRDYYIFIKKEQIIEKVLGFLGSQSLWIFPLIPIPVHGVPDFLKKTQLIFNQNGEALYSM